MRLIIKSGLYSRVAFVILVATPTNKIFSRILSLEEHLARVVES